MDPTCEPVADGSQSSQSTASVSLERQLSYMRFVSSLPRLCSPTICGTTNYKTPDPCKWAAVTPLDQSFNWSIEHKAALDPMDFSLSDGRDIYLEVDQRFSKQLDEENDAFFSQKEIIPSPKTPIRESTVDPDCYDTSEVSDSVMSMASILDTQSFECEPMSESMSRTPEPSMLSISGNDISIDCFKTPNTCSRSRQKKKLFVRDDHYLMETIGNHCSKDSAFDTIDSQTVLSPIYSPDWRKSSLSKRIAHLSPICRANYNNFIDLDFSFDAEES